MKHQLWLGTEASFAELADYERWAADHSLELIDRRTAFLDTLDGEDEPRKGEYLIHRFDNGVATVDVKGSLVNGYSWIHELMPGRVTSYEAIGDALDILAEDISVSSIVLNISSGGGAVTGIDNLSQKIRRVRASKPVKAHTSTAAFSAAYWIAASAKEIVTTRMAEVGSIGTLMVHQSIAKMAEAVGIEFTVFRAGKYKAIGLPYEDLTDEDKVYLQADIEKANDFFLEHVSLNRNLRISEKGIWAEGKTFFAEEGRQAGLIDRIASLDELVSASGAASTHTRRQPMIISAEKRAQIEAGAKPEDVLTADELTQYKAELDTPIEGESGEGTPAEGETTEGREAQEGESAQEGQEASSGGADLNQEYREALRENGRLEARLEALEGKNAELTEQLATARSQMASLQEIGAVAVKNLQVALGRPQQTADSAEGLVSAFNELQTEMAARFRPGRQSVEPAPEDANPQANVPLAFRRTQRTQSK